MRRVFSAACFVLLLIFNAAQAKSWNSPHVVAASDNVLHTAFAESPKTLDPAKAYSSNEIQFLAQIYEPIVQYHYLKRPFKLEPLTAVQMPKVEYFDKNNKLLPKTTDPKKVDYTLYTVQIKPDIYYQPHPAFAKNAQGERVYQKINAKTLENIHQISDFTQTGTRQLTANDYVYEIKRLASPKVNSPILSVMANHIVGLKAYAKKLEAIYQDPKNKKLANSFFDLRQYPLTGAKVIDPFHYQIKVKGVDPQFIYWLAMTFFSPIPWEADDFYSQPGMKQKNLSFDWYPVGTGPYQLIENNPNKQMVLEKNPNFHQEFYPGEGEQKDESVGLLLDKGRSLPFINKVIYSLDKESIPRWNKFLQGYYDRSGIGADSFDQAIQLDDQGRPQLTEEMKQQGIQLQAAVIPSTFYVGFNMLDPVVGGEGERARLLRQAISIAINYEEFIAIFMNGRGVAAHGPIPPGIAGYRSAENANKYTHQQQNDKAKRKSIAEAKNILTKAGYKNGIDPKTQKPLILHYDVASTGSPDDQAQFAWFRKQFAKLGIQLDIRSTLYNRFQEKVRNGGVQLFSWGWLADYPDPENFLFLLYGPNGKKNHGGENAGNYQNPKFDRLFEKIKILEDGPDRKKLIDQAIAIVQHDNPWVWGMHSVSFTLSHQWNGPTKIHTMANNTLKYQRLNTKLRDEKQSLWNKPNTWPLWILLVSLIILCLPLLFAYYRRENKPRIKRLNKKGL